MSEALTNWLRERQQIPLPPQLSPTERPQDPRVHMLTERVNALIESLERRDCVTVPDPDIEPAELEADPMVQDAIAAMSGDGVQVHDIPGVMKGLTTPPAPIPDSQIMPIDVRLAEITAYGSRPSTNIGSYTVKAIDLSDESDMETGLTAYIWDAGVELSAGEHGYLIEGQGIKWMIPIIDTDTDTDTKWISISSAWAWWSSGTQTYASMWQGSMVAGSTNGTVEGLIVPYSGKLKALSVTWIVDTGAIGHDTGDMDFRVYNTTQASAANSPEILDIGSPDVGNGGEDESAYATDSTGLDVTAGDELHMQCRSELAANTIDGSLNVHWFIELD